MRQPGDLKKLINRGALDLVSGWIIQPCSEKLHNPVSSWIFVVSGQIAGYLFNSVFYRNVLIDDTKKAQK